MPDATKIEELVVSRLARYLGPHTSRIAMRTFSERALGVSPGQVTATQLPALLEAMEPMLVTMVGATRAKAVINEVMEGL